MLSFVAGLVLVAVAATVVPLAEHVRYRSLIEVQPNGGRVESFVIRWPGDRITMPGQTPGADTGRLLSSGADGWRASVELFRLRDGAGNVIGLATRTASRGSGAARSGTDWLLVVPARGSLLLSQSDALDTTLGQRTSPAGDPQLVTVREDARSWAGNRRQLRVSAGPARGDQGVVLRGTGEFRGLDGTYSETWQLGGGVTDGALQGEIVLATRLMRRLD